MHEKDTPKTRIAHTKYVVCIPHTLCYSKYNHKHALLYYTEQVHNNMSLSFYSSHDWSVCSDENKAV